MMPEISIIVPVYKVENYLCECIDSILEQSFTDYELILIDDGSPDRCGDICEEYAAKDTRIKVIHQKNQGVSGARNVGIESASGKYITFIDSDDVIKGDYLRILYDILIKETANISCCGFKKFTDRCEFEKSGSADTYICMSGREAAMEQMIIQESRKTTVMSWGKLYNKQLFDHIRFPVGRIHEDEAVTPIIFSQVEKVVVCSEALYGYRVRKGNIMSASFSLQRYDGIKAIDECLAYFKQQGDKELVEAASKHRSEMIAYYSLLARKAGIYKNLPEEYKMSRIKAVRCMKENLSYGVYSYRMVKINPIFIIGAYIRKLKSLCPLKTPKGQCKGR